jgi:hypothetical protein
MRSLFVSFAVDVAVAIEKSVVWPREFPYRASGGRDGELVMGGWSPDGDGWPPAVFSVRRRYPVAKMIRVWYENATSCIFCTYNASGRPQKGAIYRLLRRAGHGHGHGPRSRQKHGSPPIEGPGSTPPGAWSRSPGPRAVRAIPIIGPNHRPQSSARLRCAADMGPSHS